MFVCLKVDKLIRVIMKDGKKETAREHVYDALEIVKRRQYKQWRQAKTEEEKVRWCLRLL